MTLTVPTGRTSLVHPLTEEFYDNPDTPNTAYSFQDPSTVKPNMQNDPSHLAAPITDAMMVSTDDEMLDSDSDPRRDEDFDIDLDNDIYSVSGDLPAVEVTMTMDEDPITYDEIEQEIDDDIMLDDEPIEYTQEEALNEFQDTLDATLMGATQHEDRNTLQDSTQAEAFSVPEPVQSDQQVHEEVPQPAYETTSQVTAVSEQNEPTTVLDDTNVAHSQLDQVGSNEAVAAQLEPLEPVTDEQTALFDNTQEPVQELDDSRSFSTATLTHGTPAADEVDSTSYHEEAVEHELQTSDEYPRPADFDPPTEHDTYDSQYQYPIIVEYEQNQLTLFPSMSDWTENPMFTEVYHNIPSRYLLQDESTCDKLLKELFLNLRNILDQAVDADSELILEIKLLGLKLNEDNPANKSVTLRRILDLHNQLCQNDGYQIPPPVSISLYSIPRLHYCLEEINNAIRERKGIREYLGPSANEANLASNVADIADTETQNTAHTPLVWDDSAQVPNEDEEAEKAEEAEDIEDLRDEPTDNASVEAVGGSVSVQVPADLPKASVESGRTLLIATESHTVNKSVNPIDGESSRKGSIAQSNISDEEELLEYEDDDNDNDQAQTEQHESSHTEAIDAAVDATADDDLLPEPETIVPNPTDNLPAPEKTPAEQTSAAPAATESAQHQETSNQNDESSNNTSAIPVFAGETEGEYDNQEDDTAAYGYQQEEESQENPGDEAEGAYSNNGHDFEQEQHAAGEEYPEGSYEDESFVAEESEYVEGDHPELEAYGEYYDEEEEYIEQEDTEYLQAEVEAEIEEFGLEEFDDAPIEIAEIEGEGEAEGLADPSATAAITVIAARSPTCSTNEEELIDYEDEEQPSVQVPKATSDMSPTSHKRFREESNDQDDEEEFDENQASKRARAE